MQHVDTFINTFLVPPQGQSPENIKDRFLHWIEVANHPERFTDDKGTHALAAKRRSARQCLRRLAARHPEIAAQLICEHNASQGVA